MTEQHPNIDASRVCVVSRVVLSPSSFSMCNVLTMQRTSDAMATPREQEEIDAALDAALDELDDGCEVSDFQETSKATKETTAKTASDTKISNGSLDSNRETKCAPVMGPVPPPPRIGDNDDPEKLLASMMQDLLRAEQQGGDISDDFLGDFMQEMQTQIKTELQKEMASSSRKASKSEPKAKKEQKPPPSQGKEVDEAISNLVEDMAKQASIADVDDDAIPEDEQEILRNIMQGIEGMEGNFDADSMIDGMMEQLVSKELMYEPMKQVAAKFPDWLEEKKDSLSQKEYDE